MLTYALISYFLSACLYNLDLIYYHFPVEIIAPPVAVPEPIAAQNVVLPPFGEAIDQERLRALTFSRLESIDAAARPGMLHVYNVAIWQQTYVHAH